MNTRKESVLRSWSLSSENLSLSHQAERVETHLEIITAPARTWRIDGMALTYRLKAASAYKEDFGRAVFHDKREEPKQQG